MNNKKTSILKCEHISKRFPGVLALDDVSFEARTGEIHAIVGANGAGKSTLSKIFSGAYFADSGITSIDGKEVDLSDPILARCGPTAEGRPAADSALVQYLTAGENIMMEKLARQKDVQLTGINFIKKPKFSQMMWAWTAR